MKTLTINLYTWDELSEKAKHNFYDSGTFDFSDDFFSDFENTLEKFCTTFDVRCFGWDVNGMTYHFSCEPFGRWMDCPEDPAKARLWIQKTLWNNYKNSIYQGKYYSTRFSYVNGKPTYKSRRSAIILESCCPLTGFFCDDEIISPIHDCLSGARVFDSPDELFDACLTKFFQSWRDDIDYHIDYHASFDYFNETMSELYSNMEFTENGVLWE